MIAEWLDGKKTHIANGIRALVSFGIMLGFQIDPDVALQHANVLIAAWATFETAMFGVISWMREIGKKKEMPV